jgi:hypothetical protein
MRPIIALAVVGSREFPDSLRVHAELERIKNTAIKKGKRLHIISGGARGVDTWAVDWAKANQIMYTVIPAEWDLLGRGAGYIRNVEIWNMADVGIAFWDGESPGTKHSIDLAWKQYKRINVVTMEKQEATNET